MSFVVLSFLLPLLSLLSRPVDTQPAPSPVAAPALVQQDLVSSEGSSAPHGNGWGAQADRIVRAPDGDLYTTYVTDGSDSGNLVWVLAERSAGSNEWQTLTHGVMDSAGGPPEVLLGPTGTVFVISISPWNSASAGAPVIWNSQSRTTAPIPGRWLTGAAVRDAGALYPAASIDGHGDIFFWEDVPCSDFRLADGSATHCRSPNVPGTYYWAYEDATDGRWQAEQWQSAGRLTYDFLFPNDRGGMTLVGTRDILQAPEEAPYECPNGSGYCFDQTVLASWPDVDKPATATIVGRAAVNAPSYKGDHRAEADDAYVDMEGRTHALVGVVDASTDGAYENHQLVIDPDGAIRDVPYTGVPYPNLSRIVQDPSGRFWIYSVGPGPDGHHCEVYIAPAGGADGTRFGPVTKIPFAGTWDCASEERNFDVSIRSGSAPAYYIDGVVPTNGGQDWVHYRIALPSASSR